jgi:hypothetical protein
VVELFIRRKGNHFRIINDIIISSST